MRLKLQYSLGDPNVWTDVTDAFGNIVQFVTTGKAPLSAAQVIGPVTLPSGVNNLPLVM